MNTLSVVAIERPTEGDQRLGATHAVRLSDGSYLAGVVETEHLAGSADEMKRIRLTLLDNDIDWADLKVSSGQG